MSTTFGMIIGAFGGMFLTLSFPTEAMEVKNVMLQAFTEIVNLTSRVVAS